MRDLYFLWTRDADVADSAYVGSLVMIKASDTERMYLAAPTLELAERLCEIHPQLRMSVIAGRELTSAYRFDFDTSRVAVIESRDDLERFASAPSRFPYDACAIRYGEVG